MFLVTQSKTIGQSILIAIGSKIPSDYASTVFGYPDVAGMCSPKQL